jgi:hypothetical protein
VEIDREHLEDLVMLKPLLLQEFGRILEELRVKCGSQATMSG